MNSLTFKGEVLNERSRRNLVILEAIRRGGPISKADISRISGVNVVTISNYIDHYVRSNLVFAKELDVSSGGRRPALLELNPLCGLAIGIGLNLMDIVGVAVDLQGNIVERVSKDRLANQGRDIKEIGQLAKDIIRELLEKLSTQERQKVQGVGIGLAGIIDHQNANLRWPEKLENGGCRYVSFPTTFVDDIEKQFKLPCLLENDATVACFGEQWMNLNAGAQNLIYMFSGVGSGLILNGEVYRGTTGNAGEISLNIDGAKDKKILDFNAQDSFFLRPWEDDLGIVRHVRKALEKWSIRSSQIFDLADGKAENISLRIIFQAAKQADKLAEEVLKEAGRLLGLKVAFLVNLLNPEIVIIGGGLEEGGSFFLDAVRETVAELAFEEMARTVKIVPSKLGNNAVALGAASTIVRRMFIGV